MQPQSINGYQEKGFDTNLDMWGVNYEFSEQAKYNDGRCVADNFYLSISTVDDVLTPPAITVFLHPICVEY